MKLQDFFELNKNDLLNIYNKESQEKGNGILYIDLTDQEKANVVYLSLSSEYLTDEVKKCLQERRPEVSSDTIFIFGVELDSNNKSIINRIEYNVESE